MPLSGTIWTDQTIWPPDIEDQVRTHSEEIRPGVYQVRCGKCADQSRSPNVIRPTGDDSTDRLRAAGKRMVIKPWSRRLTSYGHLEYGRLPHGEPSRTAVIWSRRRLCCA
jgi:hypothetical protein